MRFEDGFDPAWGLVLREPVSAEETRALLDRLAISEGGGEEGGTVGAVCEVSGVGPAVVGRMLADIRGVSWHELFSDRLQNVENRVKQVDHRLTEHESRLGLREDSVSSGEFEQSEIEEEKRRIAEERIAYRRFMPWIWGLFLIGFLIYVLSAYSTGSRQRGEMVGGVEYMTSSTRSGVQITVGENGDSWAKDAKGLRQIQGKEEEDMVMRLRSTLFRKDVR